MSKREIYLVVCTWADPEGGTGSGPPEKSQNIGFPSNSGRDPPEKSQSHQASIQCWAIIGPPAKRHGLDSPLFSGIWFLSRLITHPPQKKKTEKRKKRRKKNTKNNKHCQSWSPLTKLS